MKFFICSDLHTEFLDRQEQKALFKRFPDTEGIIIAGDLSTKKYLVDNLRYLCDKYKHVIFVTGNHEYYHSSFDFITKTLEHVESRYDNFLWLDNMCTNTVIDDMDFIGGTLWFRDSPLNMLYEKQMNDFEFIKDFRKHVYTQNKDTINLLNSAMKTNSTVVTHHLPSYQSVNEKYKGDQLNRFFVCDMENLILDKQPKYFIHGHSHSSCDYNIDRTRIICNPLGYPHERNINFKYDLIIDI